jgi:serine/threonine protein kinase/formylglycine-generating enzyme required for sulfatase activity
VIPDHEVLRKIGGGSYGEVWLARGVTGAMRAVKVVRREDFEDERGFEREFEGILKYEPISRDHPGLVNILHVGRSDAEGEFYYYVMELGDDIRTGNVINPVEYEARNLLIDLKNANGEPQDPDWVIDVGLRLSEALAHLHEKGLAHRDIKPSNIIFVGGKAKLADIGLVAARGQRTFVGTEGFVPPEGPGSSQADVYGLGKVLYEMSTGKDRLQFPELPEELPENANPKRWQALNQVICDICDPRVSKRTIKTASALADALRRLVRGKRAVRRRWNSMFMVLPVIVGLVLLGWVLRDQVPPLPWGQEKAKASEIKEKPVKKQYGFVKVLSNLDDVEVYDRNGEFLGLTPLKNIRMVAGEHYEFEFRLEGYRTVRRSGVVKANETEIIDQEMSIYAPPVEGQEWVDNMGAYYQPMDGYHISAGYVRLYQWRQYEKALGKRLGVEVIQHSESGIKHQIVLVTPELAKGYCQWQTREAVEGGYLSDSQYILPKVDTGFNAASMSDHARKEHFRPFQCVVKKIEFAHLNIHSVPEGASVLVNGVYKGTTPLLLTRIKPGEIDLSLVLEGFRRSSRMIQLKDQAREHVRVVLQRNNSVVFGQKWVNSLGMRFVPVYDDLLVSAWETRVSDYDTYVKEAKVKPLESPEFTQKKDHPVVLVSRDQAMAFCKWLTERERRQERISKEDTYRLLTDFEWSHIAGLEENPDDLPSLRELRQDEHFPWGTSWPPEKAGFKVGNLADKTAAQAVDMRRDRTLTHYDDGFAKTSPVGSFPSNEFGIYDLSGNVHEWVSDDYQGQGLYGVLRGGGWNSAEKEHLYTTHRNVVRPSKTSDFYGFRVALAKTHADPQTSEKDGELSVYSGSLPPSDSSSDSVK